VGDRAEVLEGGVIDGVALEGGAPVGVGLAADPLGDGPRR
jgi:hypothetical protein